MLSSWRNKESEMRNDLHVTPDNQECLTCAHVPLPVPCSHSSTYETKNIYTHTYRGVS